ncbi:MAG: alpha/beta hydrolase [Rhodoferax sp.]|nr:alpha/beta hydrolase [Rhodoferax sp.]
MQTNARPHSAATPLPAIACWETGSGVGGPAHFYHANGFALGVYRPLLSRLREHLSVSALHMRATWPGQQAPNEWRGWQPYADDLIAHIEQHHTQPIVGIGHSMGATCTALAAARRPDLFKTVVLIEPAMVSRPLALMARLMPRGFMRRSKLAQSTLARRDRWSSREEFAHYCQQSRAYKNFGPEAIAALAEAGVRDASDGDVELSFPKIWEAHNYMQPPHILPTLSQLAVPCVAIRGKPSVFFSQDIWQRWQAASPRTVFLEDLNHGHLLPLENPASCATLVQTGLSRIL